MLSPLVFAFGMVGVAKLLLLQPSGFTYTVAAIVSGFVVFWVIDPKLRAVSTDYEAKQARYLQQLERRLHLEYGDRLDMSSGAEG